MIQFSCRFAFFINFSSFKSDTENSANFDTVSSKRGNFDTAQERRQILIKSLQECKGYNGRQFITEFINKGWTKNSINRLLVKFRTVDRRLGSGRRSARTDETSTQLSRCCCARKTNFRAKRDFTWGGGSIDHQFRRSFTKFCVSCAARKGALNSWLKRTVCTRYFR